MGLRINQNNAAQNAYRNLSITDSQMSKALEKLSSGFRNNRAADDAAGLSISEGLRSQIGGLKVAVRNTQDGVSVAQTAECSLTEVTSILQRMSDLAVQASNSGANDPEAAAAANKEMNQLNAELARSGDSSKATGDGSARVACADDVIQIIKFDHNVTTANNATGQVTFHLEKLGGLINTPHGTGIDSTATPPGTPIDATLDPLADDATP